MDTGAYVIKCVVNGMRYVGSSVRSIGNRLSYHSSALAGGYNSNKALQSDYSKYGADAFEVTRYPAPASEARALEQKKLDYWRARGLCYNRQPSSTSPGRVWSGDEKARAGVAAKSRCTPEWRAAVSERVKRQHAEKKFGAHTWDDDARQRISAANKGNGYAKGYHHTEDARKRISEAMKRRRADGGK